MIYRHNAIVSDNIKCPGISQMTSIYIVIDLQLKMRYLYLSNMYTLLLMYSPLASET